jgi:phosphoketolase
LHGLDEPDLRRADACWRAANYLSVGQIHLPDIPLLREPLRPETLAKLASPVPRHQPHNLSGIRACAELEPPLPR